MDRMETTWAWPPGKTKTECVREAEKWFMKVPYLNYTILV